VLSNWRYQAKLALTSLHFQSAGVQTLAWVNIVREILANIVTIFRCAAASGHEQKEKKAPERRFD
jgi:hypothetical protein